MMLTEFSAIQRCRNYSERQIGSLRAAFHRAGLPDQVAVIVVGSIARREASEQSDLDYFVVVGNGGAEDGALDLVQPIVESSGLRSPAADGAFNSVIGEESFLRAIGGSDESNWDLTRRMLFLLESDWLCGEELYKRLREKMIERYIWQGITQHQLARFFLNDLIRYYRTICVDFAYKTGNQGKSWGDRSVKLLFSRKLLYFSGVIAAGETAQSTGLAKRAELLRLLDLTPLERIETICGADAKRVFWRYDKFLGWMQDARSREILKGTNEVREDHTDEFREMKNAGHHFSWDLEVALHRRFPGTHSIHQALLF